MEPASRARRVRLDELSPPSYPSASSSQILLAAEARPAVVRILLRLHPIFVVQGNPGWSIVGGLRTFRLAKAALSGIEKVPVFEVAASLGEAMREVDELLTPVLAEDLPAGRRNRWANLPEGVGRRLFRSAGIAAAIGQFRAPPARTDKRPDPSA